MPDHLSKQKLSVYREKNKKAPELHTQNKKKGPEGRLKKINEKKCTNSGTVSWILKVGSTGLGSKGNGKLHLYKISFKEKHSKMGGWRDAQK